MQPRAFLVPTLLRGNAYGATLKGISRYFSRSHASCVTAIKLMLISLFSLVPTLLRENAYGATLKGISRYSAAGRGILPRP